MTDTSIIRWIAPSDVERVLELIRELAEFEHELESVKATAALLHEALFSEPHAAEAVVAEINGQICGFALFFENFSTWTGSKGIYLEDLYVSADRRGHGIGTNLLRRLANVALERGCQRFEWAVLDWNETAIDFYISKGAEEMSEWRNYRVTGSALEELANGIR